MTEDAARARQRINSACTAMQAGTAEAKNAAALLSSASESLDHALDEICVPAAP